MSFRRMCRQRIDPYRPNINININALPTPTPPTSSLQQSTKFDQNPACCLRVADNALSHTGVKNDQVQTSIPSIKMLKT